MALEANALAVSSVSSSPARTPSRLTASQVTVCVTYENGEERKHTISGRDLPAVLLRMLLALL